MGRQTETAVSFSQKYWWLILIRGTIAISLGIAMLLSPDKTTRAMAQFMGLYWLTSGISGMAWGISGAKRPGLWLLIGLAEIAVGFVLVFRGLFDQYLAWITVTRIAAALAFSAGFLQVLAGIRTHQVYGRKWSWGSFFMGILQITLGLLFVRTPDEITRLIISLATLWAFIGGFGLITNSLRLRQQVQDNKEKG